MLDHDVDNVKTETRYMPDKIRTNVQMGWFVLALTGIIFLIAVAAKLVDETISVTSPGVFAISAVIAFVLAFGFYRKSRIAAALSVVWFFTLLVHSYLQQSSWGEYLSQVIMFGIFYVPAIRAVFEFHRLSKLGYVQKARTPG